MNPWTPLLLSHVLAALVSVPLGGYQLWRRPRGDRVHKLLGRVWVVLMLWVSLTSFAIREINDGSFSWIHILSVVTLVSLAYSIVQVRRGDVAAHVRAIRGSYLGLLGAGIGAAVVPQRMIPQFSVAHPAGAALVGLLILLGTAALIGLGHLLSPECRRPSLRLRLPA